MQFDPRDPKTYPSASYDQLLKHGTRHGGDFSGCVNVEVSRRLKESIDEFNAASSKQSEIMIGLNRWLRALTIGIVLLTFAQIGFMVYLAGK